MPEEIGVFDLVVKGGTVVTSSGLAEADVAVSEGRVAAIGGLLQGTRQVDATGKLVLPGGIDVHVHLTPMHEPAPDEDVRPDDFFTGSLAAIAGGVTTVGNMTHQQPGETLMEAIDRDAALAARDAAVDFILHPVLNDPSPSALRSIAQLTSRGQPSMKIFLQFEQFEARAGEYLEAMRVAAQYGVVVLAHCEDGAMIRVLTRHLRAEGKTAARYYPEARPPCTEVAAIERLAAFARVSGATVYVVHLSCREALESCRRARRRGASLFIETRPLYVHLTRAALERPDGAKFIGNPPLREEADVEELWAALTSGEVDTVCSDHAPWTLQQKLDPTHDVATFHPGVADLETRAPMLFSEGVVPGRITLSRFVDLISANEARIFGMYPAKGTIAEGSDADLVVWDPDLRRVVNGSAMQSRAGYSVYDGREVQGWPVTVISRGDVVLSEGTITAARGRGRLIRRIAARDRRPEATP